MQIVGISPDILDGFNPSHSVNNDFGQLTSFQAGAHSGGSSGSNGPASTLVGFSTGLEINLIWDLSVRTSSNWAAIENAVAAAAKIYTTQYSDPGVVLNIGVGYGEVGGTTMSRSALGESEN